MNRCERTRRVGAYHDGELHRDAACAMAEHIAGCADCAAELERLRTLSRLLGDAVAPVGANDALSRLHARIDGARERGIARMAETLMAIAATVLVACAAWLWLAAGGVQAAPAPNPWEQAAVTLRVDATTNEALQVAQWIVQDLSRENGHDEN